MNKKIKILKRFKIESLERNSRARVNSRFEHFHGIEDCMLAPEAKPKILSSS
jgi:hypothetical protein